jgi:hypothetical protein
LLIELSYATKEEQADGRARGIEESTTPPKQHRRPHNAEIINEYEIPKGTPPMPHSKKKVKTLRAKDTKPLNANQALAKLHAQ